MLCVGPGTTLRMGGKLSLPGKLLLGALQEGQGPSQILTVLWASEVHCIRAMCSGQGPVGFVSAQHSTSNRPI